VVQETRRFDMNTGKTSSMRSKENADDYRYFPDPDLVPIVISPALFERLKNEIPMLPDQRKQVYQEKYGLSSLTAENLVTRKDIADYFETVAEDGYLTLRFRTLWGGGKAHGVSLVHRSDANTPYLLDFYHNANGDSKGYVSDWVAAFRLPDEFNQGREPITITLRWKSFQKQAAGDSVKTTTFKYKPRR